MKLPDNISHYSELAEESELDMPLNVSLSSDKPLTEYQADSPMIYHTTLKELFASKEAVATKLSDPLKKAIPIVIIMAGLMGFVLLISNMPPIIDAVAKYVGVKEKVVEVEKRVEIVYMTPEEAAKQGVKVEPQKPNDVKPVETRPVITPEPIREVTPPVNTREPPSTPAEIARALIPAVQVPPIPDVLKPENKTTATPVVEPPVVPPETTPEEPEVVEPTKTNSTNISDQGSNKPNLLPE